MRSCRECCYAAPTGANLYCSINDCYVGELTCDEFEPIVKLKTNADHIRAMSDKELAEFMRKASGCGPVWDKEYCHSRPKCGNNCWLDWLKAEVKEGET